MGGFENSLKRELGKNTGKFISNVIFGDKHSTPYRRVGNSQQSRNRSSAGIPEVRYSAEAKVRQLETKEKIARDRRYELYAIDGAVLQSIEALNSQSIPRAASDLADYLFTLSIQLKAEHWKTWGEEAHIRNKFSDALLEKYRLCIQQLRFINPSEPQLISFDELLKDKDAEARAANIVLSGGQTDPQTQRILSEIRQIQIESDTNLLQRQLGELTIKLKTFYWKPFGKSAKSQNEIADAVFNKYCDCLTKIKLIDAVNPYVDSYKQLKNIFVFGRFFTKNAKRILMPIGFALSPFALYILFLLIDQSDRSLRELKEYNVYIYFFLLFVAVIIGAVIFFKISKNKKIKEVLSTSSSRKHTSEIIRDKDPEDKMNEQVDNCQHEVVEHEAESLFLDLNENLRIEKRLTEIWKKYSRSVPSKIIQRQPIFSADGVNNSILYVGVNPSYSPEDDSTLIPSMDKKSLMYGSFYQLSEAPGYFKKLEKFASDAGKAYTHINLLYAREDNRDFLIHSNAEFIREQLELSYDTILKLNPVAIIFFSDYCQELIFGADRWVNPTSEVNDRFTLKNTNIPVFFTDDITVLPTIAREQLLVNVKRNI